MPRGAPVERSSFGEVSGPPLAAGILGRVSEQGGAVEAKVPGAGTRESPWELRTPPGSSEYQMYRDEESDALVCVVGKTTLGYRLRAIEDLHEMLSEHGDWMDLGSADEQKPAKEGTVEAWARSETNPVGGWYGTKKGLRGRFAMYMPPLLEALGLADSSTTPATTAFAPSSF